MFFHTKVCVKSSEQRSHSKLKVVLNNLEKKNLKNPEKKVSLGDISSLCKTLVKI